MKETKFFSRLYVLYSWCLISILKIISLGKTKKTIMFVSYGGKQVSDSPKRIFDLMQLDPFFKDYRLVWGVLDTDKYSEMGYDVVKMDSINYFRTCISARVWITNSGIKRYTNMKGNRTFFVNTWHGIPMKKIGKDEVSVKKSPLFQKKWEEFATADVNLYYTDYDYKILKHVFNANAESMKRMGLPRNDSLYEKANTDKIRQQLGIPSDKKVILYAPTVRGNQTESNGSNDFRVPIHLEKWAKELPNYVILFRAHYFVNKVLEDQNKLFYDVTDYPSLNELMQVSDLLVTDYSSLIYDYSILQKPIFCYAYDFDAYKAYQGLYEDDVDKKVPNFIQTEADLIDAIKNVDVKSEKRKTHSFYMRYIGENTRDSGKRVLATIKEAIQ
ncbi:CDP-glycerol glycerophosphotransferase family protein [Lactiplantibacillus xiangfangensis]|uniref:CDP-glycerol glycerophosphotransferase family protein n=1 Tax=Lactiplantibacillus xiangfangensis TaxID=942150 RepID=UPI003850CDFB